MSQLNRDCMTQWQQEQLRVSLFLPPMAHRDKGQSTRWAAGGLWIPECFSLPDLAMKFRLRLQPYVELRSIPQFSPGFSQEKIKVVVAALMLLFSELQQSSLGTTWTFSCFASVPSSKNELKPQWQTYFTNAGLWPELEYVAAQLFSAWNPLSFSVMVPQPKHCISTAR